MGGAAGDGRLILLAALALSASGPADPRIFVEQLYERYREGRPAAHDDVDAIYARPLAAAIKTDARLAGPGEVGALDWDPICDCQDGEGLRANIRRIDRWHGNGFEVLVDLRFPGGAELRPARLMLEYGAHGWRVADLTMKDGRSLRAWLDRQNALARGRLQR